MVGAGVAGLQQGRALQKRGIDFHIYEADALVGGVWRVTTHLQGAQGRRSDQYAVAAIPPSTLSPVCFVPWMGHSLDLRRLVPYVVAYPYYEFPEFPWPEELKQQYKGAVTAPAPAVQQYIQVLLVNAACWHLRTVISLCSCQSTDVCPEVPSEASYQFLNFSHRAMANTR